MSVIAIINAGQVDNSINAGQERLLPLPHDVVFDATNMDVCQMASLLSPATTRTALQPTRLMFGLGLTLTFTSLTHGAI